MYVRACVRDTDSHKTRRLAFRASIQKEKSLLERTLRQGLIMKGGVVPPGIEPGTHGFSVRCSTN